MPNFPGHVTFYLMDFVEFLPVVGIIEIWKFNSKQFRVCGILKQLQIDDDKGKGWPQNTKVS